MRLGGGEGPSSDYVELRKSLIRNVELPPEVTSILEEYGSPEDKVGWLAAPQLETSTGESNPDDTEQSSYIDAHELIKPFLGNSTLDSTLRTMDVLNGCCNQCDTCLADSPPPTKVFTLESLKELFGNENFIRMLQPDSLRIGSSGDVLNHPQGVEIVQLALDATKPLDEALKQQTGSRHQVKIFTNYRPRVEQQLDNLIALASNQSERMQLKISLPLNRTDEINQKFAEYVTLRPEIFEVLRLDENGLAIVGGKAKMENIHVLDTRHPHALFNIGRGLPVDTRRTKVPEHKERVLHNAAHFVQRGFGKVYLNPDALWMMVYGTSLESHTTRLFKPITPDNIGALSHIPYHSDFPTPPNWPGGVGVKKDWQEAGKLASEAESSGSLKPMHEVGWQFDE